MPQERGFSDSHSPGRAFATPEECSPFALSTCAEELLLSVALAAGSHTLPVLQQQRCLARGALKPIGAG